MKPRKGLRFLHSRVVNWDDRKTPALYEVTKVARGTVYYAPVYDRGIVGSERLGTRECCALEYFPKVMLQAVLTAEDIERIAKKATEHGSAINRNPQRFD